jgi:flagellum-specific peptidoglycan hydrolase FlgJ
MSLTAAQILFLQKAATAARAAQGLTGIPASISIAQAILESGWGRSGLAMEANNYFGIKARQSDDYAEFPTAEFENGVKEEVMAKFARYPSPIESFQSHAALLLTLPRYKPCMECKRDPAAFAQQLQRCGYSTSPTYADSLMGLVREFNLTQYDNPPEPTTQANTQEKAA